MRACCCCRHAIDNALSCCMAAGHCGKQLSCATEGILPPVAARISRHRHWWCEACCWRTLNLATPGVSGMGLHTCSFTRHHVFHACVLRAGRFLFCIWTPNSPILPQLHGYALWDWRFIRITLVSLFSTPSSRGYVKKSGTDLV